MELNGISNNNLQAVQTQALSGAQRAVNSYAAETAKISQGDLQVGSIVEANQQTTLYQANLQVVKTTDELVGQVLNLRA